MRLELGYLGVEVGDILRVDGAPDVPPILGGEPGRIVTTAENGLWRVVKVNAPGDYEVERVPEGEKSK